jgi:DMSO/TMAO reductase YedYZ heme-binding membrane subunit
MPFLGLGIFASAYIIYHGIAHEPLIDFRDYKIGTDLNLEKQKIAG